MDPVDNSVYVGGAQGGVWKSTDNGATWTALTDGLSWLAVGSIAPGHRDDVVERPVVHDGEHRRQRRPREVGEQRLELGRAYISATVDIPTTPTNSVLYLGNGMPGTGTSGRLYKSVGSGANWTAVTAANGYCDGQCFYDMPVYVEPDDLLKRQGGQCSIEGRVRRNDGTRADTGFISITNAAHFIEFDWIKASTGLANGTFTLVLDQFVSRRVNYNGPES